MSNDLIERLHDVAAASRNHDGETDALIDAADTIERLTARNEVLEAVIKHIHWSMGDRRIFSDEARDVICDLCDKALAAEDKDDAG